LSGIRHCPNCNTLLGDNNTCPNCGYRSTSFPTTTRSRPESTVTVSQSPTTRTTSSTIDVMATTATITPPPPNVSKFRFTIGGRLFEIENLDGEMNSLFRDLHIDHYGGPPCDRVRFREQALAFFDANQGRPQHDAHDRFFQNFYIIWSDFLEKQFYGRAAKLWESALDIAYDWEAANSAYEIHKGTPYYFWGVTCILNRQLDEALLLMHQALDEDKKTHGTETPPTPAYSFVTLDPTQKNQFFREKVIEISDFVRTLLDNYNSTRGGCLTFPQLQSRFLRQTNVQEVVFHFVYGVIRLKDLLDEIYPRMKHNVFSSLLEANALFDLCLAVDAFVKSKYSSPPARATFGTHLNFLSANREHGLPAPLSFVGGKVGQLRSAFTGDFAGTLQDLLLAHSTFRFSDRSTLQPIEKDFAIAYGVRNFAGHRIENQPIIYRNFEELSRRILNTLFFLVENCT